MLYDPADIPSIQARVADERQRFLMAEDARAKHRLVIAPVEAMCHSIRLATWQRIYGMPPREDIQRPFDPADACSTAKEAAEKIDALRATVIDDIRAERIESDVAKSAKAAIKRLSDELEILQERQKRKSAPARKGSKKDTSQGGLI